VRPDSRLQGLGGGTQDDLVGVHVLGLLDGVGDGAGYRTGVYRHVFELAGALRRFLMGDVAGQLALDRPREMVVVRISSPTSCLSPSEMAHTANLVPL
jgi:hypothetical protein